MLGEKFERALAHEDCRGGVVSGALAVVETMRRVGVKANRRSGLSADRDSRAIS